jgi:hypothetical protein
MFFALICLLMTVLLATGHTPDMYGWIMLVGLSWLAGYLDCRKFSRSDQEKDRVMPPDARHAADIPDDNSIFES